MLYKQIIIVVSLSTLAACAATDTGADSSELSRSDCISQSSIRGYNVLDESNLIVSAGGRRQYHVTLRRRAHGLKSTWGLGFKSATSRICAPFSEVVFTGHSGGHVDSGPFRIASIRQLSPEEEEDLLIRYGKKEPDFERTPVPQEVKGAEVEELDPVADGESSAD